MLRSKWWKRVPIGIPIGIVVLLFIGLICYNVKEQKADFFEASVVDCITILVAVVISYYLVQRQNNYQRQKDIISDMVLKMQVSFEQKELYDFCGQDKQTITMRNRGLNNRIHILETLAEEFNIVTEVDFVRHHFDEYSDFIGNHIENMEYLCQSQNELRRPVESISQKLIEIAVHLYK